MNTATVSPAPQKRAPAQRAPESTVGPAPAAYLSYGRASSAAHLLEQAASGLEQARHAGTPTSRFAQARLAGLRAGAAVLATRAAPSRLAAPMRSRPSSVWALLAHVAPELGEWSAFFASYAATQSITARDADDMLRQSEQFLVLAGRAALPRCS
ncbi:MAG: SAV_6107 family HEPN domain-containing protein [Mycobacteriaceae bacterium]